MVNINLQGRTVRYRTLNQYGRHKLYTKPDCVVCTVPVFHWMGAQVQVEKVVNQCIVCLDRLLFCCLVSVCVCVCLSVWLSVAVVCMFSVKSLIFLLKLNWVVDSRRLQPKLFVNR